MRRKVPDLSATQLAAGGLATLAAAVGASFLGVYGTILGAAFMSVASTAGAAVCKHFLDRGREQIKDREHGHGTLRAGARDEALVGDAVAEATSADPTRAIVLPGGDPGATRLDLPPPPPRSIDPDVTRVDRTPAEIVADELEAAAGGPAAVERSVRRAARRDALRDTLRWARRRWAVLAVSSAAVFAVVMAGITVLEKITDRPASGWVGVNEGKGTTWGNLGDGSGGRRAPAPSPEVTRETPQPSGTPTPAPGTTAPAEPDGTPAPAPAPGDSGVPEPGGPTQAPTSGPGSPAPEPTGPTAPGGGSGGGQDGGGTGSTGAPPG
ncbi:hypothetical protein ACFY4C_18795 [Actinomadura viridis]|uniref:hypothetical protein n=1 Tax=Actinomadura viridis TaxID=58110 RepID=UPI003699B63D